MSSNDNTMMETMMSPTQYLDDVLEGNESDEEDLFTDDEVEEEITKEYAILTWLQTFPHVKNVITDVKIAVEEWYGQESTMSALLVAATQICNKSKDGCMIKESKTSSWESIASSLQCIMAPNKESHLAMFYELLCYAVSDNCTQKNTYVGRIIELDKGIQRVLMQIIKEGEDVRKIQYSKSPHPDESYLDDLNIDEDNESLLDDYEESIDKENIHNINTPLSISTSLSKRTPMSIRSPKYQYRSPMASRNNSFAMFSGGSSRRSTPLSISPNETNRGKLLQMQREAIQLKDTNQALSNELEVYRRQESILRAKLEETEAKNRADKLKIETDSLAKTSTMREHYEQTIESLEHKLKKAQKNADHSDTMKEEIITLKDEIDVLQSSKTKLKHTEEQLRKMKQKVEQMGDLHKALESEEKAHSEAVAKCIELENKLAVLAPLKRQLEDYKTRATDAEVRLVDCEDELKKLKDSRIDMIDQNKELQVNSQLQKKEVEELRQQMTEDSSVDNNKKVGEGMSELNPVLKEELLRLRNENKRLSAFAAKREDDAVQIMEETLDDTQRLAEKFKEQFLSTKSILDETKGSLEASLLREKGLQNEIHDLQEINASLKQTIDAERKSAKEAAGQASQTLSLTIERMGNEHRKQTEEINKGWEAKLSQIETEHERNYQNLCTQLEKTEQNHNQSKAEMLNNHTNAIAKLNAEREEAINTLQEEHLNEVKLMEQNNSIARDDLITKGKQMIETLKNEANEKIKSLESSLASKTEEKDNLIQQQAQYECRVAKKIAAYKQKLNVAQAGIQEAAAQCDDVERKMKKVEKEKSLLQDENDRYRRQMNGRFGLDQSQYEALQHEYNLLLEENQLLKSSPNAVGFGGPEGAINAFGVNASRLRYSIENNVSASSISQIREEYEEQIEALCDEKRQLIMKNSALVTDEKRALTQVWDLEVKCKDLQELNTSLQLQIERYQRNRSGATVPKKRLASNISPRSANKPSMKVAKSCSTPLAIQSLNGPSSPIISPTDSTTPNVEFRSPEFRKSVKSFKARFLGKLSSTKMERKHQNVESQSKINDLQLADDEWKVHIN